MATAVAVSCLPCCVLLSRLQYVHVFLKKQPALACLHSPSMNTKFLASFGVRRQTVVHLTHLANADYRHNMTNAESTEARL